MNIMFMGTPDFAVNSLKALHSAGHNISAVVTVPDKPRGRGHKMTHTPVYEEALKLNVPIYTPENLKRETFFDILDKVSPDIIVVVAYGKILPEYILNYPKYGCVNVHASLLPKYRGAAPIQRSIIEGEKITGVTTMYMAKGLDTGDMLLKTEVAIEDNDNFETLHNKLSDAGASLIVSTLEQLFNNTCKPQAQDDALSTYAHMITKETCLIDWNKNARDVHNLIRGLSPVPKAFTTYGGKQLKILSSRISDNSSKEPTGTILSVKNDSITVSCGEETAIDILSIQFEGKKPMSVFEYLKGNTISEHLILGR